MKVERETDRQTETDRQRQTDRDRDRERCKVGFRIWAEAKRIAVDSF